MNSGLSYLYNCTIDEFIFHLGSGSCPECEAPLRRVNFKLQLFEDASIDKEVTIRRQVLRDFCQTQDDFETLREWNDYLEQVEDIIFNLVNNIDKEETERTIAKYKESNKQFIKKNQYVAQIYLKFIYSEKATKFCEIFPLHLTVCTVVKCKGKISQNFVAFSEYMSFTIFPHIDSVETILFWIWKL